MTESYQLGSKIRCAGRELCPVIRVCEFVHESGGWISADPVAILIEENGELFFAGLEEGVTEEILHLIPAIKGSSTN